MVIIIVNNGELVVYNLVIVYCGEGIINIVLKIGLDWLMIYFKKNFWFNYKKFKKL